MFGPEFFPTPRSLIRKMLDKLKRDAHYYLDPSAGKGDIAEAIQQLNPYGRAHVDCIESNPELVALLLGKGLRVVGYDWLTHTGVCYYDAIVMNPPFSSGDEHLLRAWDFMHDGEIVCLLNEETVLNPCTKRRERLAALIERHGEVEFLGSCFDLRSRKTQQTERVTGVRVALVYLNKLADDDRVDLWARDANPNERPRGDDGATHEHSDETSDATTMLAIRDELGNMEHWYNMANEHFLRAVVELRKARAYLEANRIYVGSDYERITQLAFGNVNSARAEFTQKHRRDAWLQVFERMEFRNWLDHKQTNEFIREIERNGDIPFTAANIKGTLENVWLERGKLFEKSVANVFDELTRYHATNTNHVEGWKTNDSYKVNERLVFPWGVSYEKGIFGGYRLHSGSRVDIYDDLDRIVCVLDGTKFAECWTIGKALEERFRASRGEQGEDLSVPNNRAQSDYFDIKFWKKGTLHLKWRDLTLWERFNVTAAKGKKWLGEDTRCGKGKEQ